MYVPLPAPPLGPLSTVLFSPIADVLLVASLDDSVLLYNCQGPDGIRPRLVSRLLAPSPVLSSATAAHNAFAGLLDGSVRPLDYENMRLGPPLLAPPTGSTSGSAGIGHLRTAAGESNLLVAASFAGTLTYLDPRAHRMCHQHTSSKILALDTSPRRVTVARSAGSVEIFDLRLLDRPCETRPSGLRFQVTALSCSPAGDAYALASIDGRVLIEHYSSDLNHRNYAFKCHRHKSPALDLVYPVTRLLFHNRYNSLLTCGTDGHVCVWNWHSRKRMKQFPRVPLPPTALSHMDINYDGSLLAVGATDDLYLRRGCLSDPVPDSHCKVYLRSLGDADCLPKL